MFRRGYILDWRGDLIWFLGLPFLAILAALASHQWLPAVAQASVGLWVTIPHHFATWLRTYGLPDDWRRWKTQLIVGPLVIGGLTIGGLVWAPLTLGLLTMLWDHQHSIMQQHGLARIYDFKAQAGSKTTPRFDLWLNWVLYVNMLITAPTFVNLWVRELYRWQLPVSAETVRGIQWASAAITAAYLLVYLGHVVGCWRAGCALNPLKYCFLGASYLLWYFTSWHTDSLIVFGIAHRLMHGLQYIVIVHSYVRRKTRSEEQPTFSMRLARPGHIVGFVAMCAAYAVLYQLIVKNPLEEFGFGVVTLMQVYRAIPELGFEALTQSKGYDLFASLVISAAPLTHYYLDSFIWKVSDTKVQQGL